MGAESKQIKIEFVADPQSARKTVGIIRDITREVEKLVAATAKVGSGMGGMFGGISAKSGKAGPGGTTHAATAGGANKGGIVGTILGIQDPNSLRTLLSGTQQGFASVSGSVKTFVDKSLSDIGRLQRAVDGLNRSMSGMGGGIGGGRGGGGGAQPPPIPDMTKFAKLEHSSFRMTPPGEKWNVAGNQVKNLMTGDFQGFLGGPGGKAGAMFGAFAGGVALSEKIMGAMTDERATRLSQTLNQPFDTLSRQAQIAQPFLSVHAAVQGRDVNRQRAFMDAMRDPQIRESLGKVELRREAVIYASKQGTSTLRGVGKEMWNDFRNWVGGKTGVSTDDAFTFINNLPGDEVTKKTMRDIVRDNAIANMDPAAAAQFQQAVESKRALQDPTTATMLSQVYGNAAGRVGQMRGMGMGTSIVSRGRGPGAYQTSLYEDMEQKLMRGGWSMSDQAAGRSQLLQVGLGYGKAVSPIGLISAGIGGLGNAAALMQAGGTLAGSVAGASGMYAAAQRSIGRGGLDVAAGRELFSGVAGRAMASGQFGGSRAAEQYGAITAGLIGGGSEVPLDVGAQQRNLGLITAGTAAFARFTQGTEAPLYRATSLQGAIAANGGYGAGAEALTKMSPELLTAMARGGDIPEWAKSLGLGAGEASKYLQYQRKAPLFEVVDDLVGGRAGKTLASVRAAEAGGGDFMDVIGAEVGVRRGGESSKAYQRRRAAAATGVATDLGAAMFASGLVQSPDEGAGIFLGQMAQNPDYAPALKARGVGAAAPQGAEKEALAREADLVKQHGIIVTKLENIIKGLPAATTLEQQADRAVGGISAGAGQAGLPGSVGNLIAALETFRMGLIRANQQQPQKAR